MSTATERGVEHLATTASPLVRALDPTKILLIGDFERFESEASTILRSFKGLAGASTVITWQIDRLRDHTPRDLSASFEDMPPDLVIVGDLDVQATIEAVELCGDLGIETAAIIRGGFDKPGEAGVSLDQELRHRARKRGIRIIGPGAFGPFNRLGNFRIRPHGGLNASGTAFAAQSGNVILDTVSDMAVHNLYPEIAWALGSMADVTLIETLDSLSTLPKVRSIGLHCEGIEDGVRFTRSVAIAARQKPVVVLMGATSEEGKRAAISHTGSLGVPKIVAEGALSQAGATIVERVDEFAIVTTALATVPPAPGRRVAIVSDGGGHATLAVDRIIDRDLQLANLNAETLKKLESVVGHQLGANVPLDIGNREDPGIGFRCAAVLAQAEEVDMILIVGCFGSYAVGLGDPRLVPLDRAGVRDLAQSLESSHKPVVAAMIYAGSDNETHDVLRRAGVAVTRSLDHAATVCLELAKRGEFLRNAAPLDALPDVKTAGGSNGNSKALDEVAARQMMVDAGIPSNDFRLAVSAQEAVRAVQEMGKLCALKIVSPTIVHKSDVGGVRLNVGSEEAAQAFDHIIKAGQATGSDAIIQGVIITPMAAAGTELIVGAFRDHTFGPCVAVGSGGFIAEVLRDITFMTAPVTQYEARKMILKTRASSLMSGYRGRPAVDVTPVVNLVVKLSNVIASRPEITEVDLNPVILTPEGANLVDVRVVVAEDCTTNNIRQ